MLVYYQMNCTHSLTCFWLLLYFIHKCVEVLSFTIIIIEAYHKYLPVKVKYLVWFENFTLCDLSFRLDMLWRSQLRRWFHSLSSGRKECLKLIQEWLLSMLYMRRKLPATQKRSLSRKNVDNFPCEITITQTSNPMQAIMVPIC